MLNHSIVIRIVLVGAVVVVLAVVAVFSINETIDTNTGSLAALEMKSINLVRFPGC
jgi:hypothetical protein